MFTPSGSMPRDESPTSRRPTKLRTQKNRARPGLEALEGRSLLSTFGLSRAVAEAEHPGGHTLASHARFSRSGHHAGGSLGGLRHLRGGVSAPVAANPIPTPPIWQNPYLVPNNFSGIHVDAYQTDTTAVRGPVTARGSSPLVVQQKLLGPIPIGIAATITFDAHGQIVTLQGYAKPTSNGIKSGRRLMLMDPTTLKVLASYELPSGGGTSFGAGGYFVLGKDSSTGAEEVVLPTVDQKIDIFQIAQSATGYQFELVKAYDLSPAINDSTEVITSLIRDSGGHIWFATGQGLIGDIDPSDGSIHLAARNIAPDGSVEAVSNSLAADEDGGVYIVSNYALYRYTVSRDGSPTIVWRTAYDRGTRVKTGQMDQGCGTTPTAFNDFEGNKFVTIADNADPYMHVNIYNRETGQLVAQQAVFGPYQGATENSLIAVNHSIIVENNYGFTAKNTLGARTTVGGVDRVDFDPGTGQSHVTWSNPVSVPSVVSKLSTADGLVYTYTKQRTGWYFSALDYNTGTMVANTLVPWSKISGGTLADNWYSGIGIGPNGTAYTGVFGGIVAWHRK